MAKRRRVDAEGRETVAEYDANPDAVVAPAPSPAVAPDDNKPLMSREVIEEARKVRPVPLAGGTTECPHGSECGFEERQWSGLPVWQCDRCGFDSMERRAAMARRPDLVKDE